MAAQVKPSRRSRIGLRRELLLVLALGITVALIGLQKLSMWLIARWAR